MAVSLMVERDPSFEADLKANFRPSEIREGNFPLTLINQDTGRRKTVYRRQRRIRHVSLDQNRECELITDLGPANWEQMYVMPCSDAVEMAEALEVIEWAKQMAAEHREREKWVAPLRTTAFLGLLQESNEEAGRRKLAASTFSTSHKVQR